MSKRNVVFSPFKFFQDLAILLPVISLISWEPMIFFLLFNFSQSILVSTKEKKIQLIVKKSHEFRQRSHKQIVFPQLVAKKSHTSSEGSRNNTRNSSKDFKIKITNFDERGKLFQVSSKDCGNN